MIRVPESIDSAKVLFYTSIDERHQATNSTEHLVDGEPMGSARFLAICQFLGDSSFYLFYCDENWAVMAENRYDSLEEVRAQAESEYTGSRKTWLKCA